MVTTPSTDIVPNYGMDSLSMFQAIPALLVFPARRLKNHSKTWLRPLPQKIYLRPNWREVQSRPGKLDFPDW